MVEAGQRSGTGIYMTSDGDARVERAATRDYGGDTHSYDYEPGIAFPADPWRSLPGVEIDNPDDLPID